MTTSELIELWYIEFCIQLRKPKPDFKTFCQMMGQHDWDYEATMKTYTEKFDRGEL